MRQAEADLAAGGGPARCETVFNDYDIGFHQTITLGAAIAR